MGPLDTDYEEFNNSNVASLTFNTSKTISGFNWTPGNDSDYRIIRTSRNTLYKFRFMDYYRDPYITQINFKPIK